VSGRSQCLLPKVCLTLCITCEPTWRGPCASTGRDRLDRQVHALVSQPASVCADHSDFVRLPFLGDLDGHVFATLGAQ
jgi:hypothetical protein